MLEDKLLKELKADYLTMCLNDGVEFESDKFETYLDKLFEAMNNIFAEVQGGC